jgi:signal transduction histidine kinase
MMRSTRLEFMTTLLNQEKPMKTLGGRLAETGKPVLMAGCLAILSVIGVIDYLTGYHVSLLVLYMLPIGFGTLYVGPRFGTWMAGLSVIIWQASNLLAGMPYRGIIIHAWNTGIFLSLFLILVYLLHNLRGALEGLEAKVRDRTEALQKEMEERQRLEREILDLTERERQRFGHELHDVVCQELAGIAIASHLLTKKLQTNGSAEADRAREIATMLDRALTKTRSVAGGFFTAGFDVAGLAEALRETARNVQQRTGVHCHVRWQENLMISNEDVVMHFFRIAQEAIQNAVNHASATRIEVALKRQDETVQLTIADDGSGLPSSAKTAKGLGLRIMAYRAKLIGGELKFEPQPNGGTRVVCIIPAEKIARKPALTL